jgi:ABC-type multidrug transport system fused ATPase/permease subunit
MRGLTTIRAFDTVDYEVRRSEELIDASQRPAYLLAMIQEWLLATLTLVVGVIGVVLTTLATQLGTSASFTGASLLALMNLATSLTWVMKHYTALETSLGAVNRIKTFSTNVKDEAEGDSITSIPNNWPSEGSLVFYKVSASYGSSNTTNNDADESESPFLALNEVSLSIQPREKVAICGRTGRYVPNLQQSTYSNTKMPAVANRHSSSYCFASSTLLRHPSSSR